MNNGRITQLAVFNTSMYLQYFKMSIFLFLFRPFLFFSFLKLGTKSMNNKVEIDRLLISKGVGGCGEKAGEWG